MRPIRFVVILSLIEVVQLFSITSLPFAPSCLPDCVSKFKHYQRLKVVTFARKYHAKKQKAARNRIKNWKFRQNRAKGEPRASVGHRRALNYELLVKLATNIFRHDPTIPSSDPQYDSKIDFDEVLRERQLRIKPKIVQHPHHEHESDDEDDKDKPVVDDANASDEVMLKRQFGVDVVKESEQVTEREFDLKKIPWMFIPEYRFDDEDEDGGDSENTTEISSTEPLNETAVMT